jgi:hypothetical protein
MSTRVVGVRAAWGIVRPHPPHDHPDIPVPGHPAPSYPQVLVLRYRRQAPCGNLEETPLGVGPRQPLALDQVEVEALVSVQQVLFALGQRGHTIRLRRMIMGGSVAQRHPEHEPDTRPGIRPCRSPPSRLCAACRRERRPLVARQ